MIISCESCHKKYVEKEDKQCESCIEIAEEREEENYSWGERHGLYLDEGGEWSI